MAIRCIDTIAPREQGDTLLKIAAEQAVIDAWQLPLADGEHVLVRMLVPAARTEALTDLINGHAASASGFRIVVTAVEAALPPEPESNTEDDNQQQQGQIDRISRDELYQDVVAGARLSPVYAASVILATLIAAIGLVRDDVAIIIGAMVIAPLLGPNVALALAATLGDRALAQRALIALGAGLALALLLSFGIGLALRVDPTVPAIEARTGLTLDNLLLALAAGGAGVLAVTSGTPATVIGVMVAVALLPPLATAGLLAGAGHTGLAGGALLLFAGNVIGVNLAGVLTFFWRGVRPRTWWEAEQARAARRMAISMWVLLFAGLCVVIVISWQP